MNYLTKEYDCKSWIGYDCKSRIFILVYFSNTDEDYKSKGDSHKNFIIIHQI